MIDDPIVAEVHKARQELLRRCGGDLAKLVKYLQQRSKQRGLKVVRLRPKRTKRTISRSR